ncbi:hypothetical protein KB206_07350 [Microvirga sp. STS02]|uniref:pirin family protein n=1 Tax=Hymenobacter negativus TaxID=2795026 RepID=UPI0018DC1B30|nr:MULTISPECIES: hypothetical protein [Bacteria]MBH8568690.1 hypothetical protein [Hymenobacter negativus]MBR7208424.1 hypothetical protein [Microvirga sp. STS02]
MIAQTPGKIFLADERGLAESDRFRRYSTFSFGAWARPHKGPFGRLFGLNEETLADGHTLVFTVVEASHVFIVPITGAVVLASDVLETTVSVEEATVLTLPADSTLHVRNPYDTKLVSFLHLWLLADAPAAASSELRGSFSSEAIHNQLARLLPATDNLLPFTASLGRFDGRQEAVYQLENTANSLFVFVLAGAFEVESRLLHEKDGLALWDVAEIELEALSNDALILVLELAPLAS